MSTFDPIREYLNAIGKIPLLTHDEELMLARSIHAWIADRTSSNPCPRIARRGKRAKDRMVNGNLRLVVSMSRSFLGRGQTLTMMDLIQEGNIGLIKAAERFDPARGYKFSTYATWWIRAAMYRVLAQNDRIVRLPTAATDILNNMRHFVWRFRQDFDRFPSIEECAKEAGISVEFMRYYLFHQSGCLSLDKKVNGNRGSDEATLGSFITSDTTDPLEAVEFSMLREKIDGWKAGLTELQVSVINRHYGLDGQEPQTLTTIGKELGVSRECIRQHEQRGLRKMRLASCLGAGL
jgi:RNA polymerase sigma factor (sigma-70 family)